MPFPLNATVWLKLIGPAIEAIRSLRSVGMRRRRLIFAQRTFSVWAPGRTGEQQIITIPSQFAVTNQHQREGIIIVRARVGRGIFAYGHSLQDCNFCVIGGERVDPFSPGVKIEPRTTSLMQLNHPFEVDSLPRTEWIWVRIVLTDQFNRGHSKRARLRRAGPIPPAYPPPIRR
jgi:hypothetical protein